VLAVIGLLSFIGTMNDFLIASVILVDPDKQTLPSVSTSSSRRRRRATGASSRPARCSPRSCRWPVPLLQRFIVGGLTAGSVK
jgi:arabinogalactan oligomer/maltooligosaccharide transport system permease protein